ncbi:MAG TPA: hypothetical protein VFQ22_11115 [Longimicrobiales bacterium]|nr:hypothetical protein [Longimicrobiales bacterium]
MPTPELPGPPRHDPSGAAAREHAARDGAPAQPALPPRVFLLSPASLGGVRGRRLLEGGGATPLAERLRAGAGAPLAEVYTEISSLYFRGKLGYARRFANRPVSAPGVLAITPCRGLVDVDAPVTLADLRAFASTPIGPGEPAYLEALTATALMLRAALPEEGAVVLLGSIASPKYVEPLGGVFGARLWIPKTFVGRGDMSRGGLLLRAVREGRELEYVPALATVRRGARPPRLGKLRG